MVYHCFLRFCIEKEPPAPGISNPALRTQIPRPAGLLWPLATDLPKVS